MTTRVLLCLAAGYLSALVALVQPATVRAALGEDDWKYDVVYRKQGEPFKGLVVENNDRHVVIKCITRRPGKPTIVFAEVLPRGEVAHVELLDPQERDRLHKRLEGLRTSANCLRPS